MIVAVTTFWYTWSMGSEENVGKGRYYPHSCRDFFFLFKAGKIRKYVRERKKKWWFQRYLYKPPQNNFEAHYTVVQSYKKMSHQSFFQNNFHWFLSLVIKASFISLVRSKDLEKIRDFFFVEFTPLCHLFLRLWVTRKIRRPWVRIIRWSIIKTPSIARRRRRQNNREKTVILCENNH